MTAEISTQLQQLKDAYIKQGLSEDMINKCFTDNIKSTKIKNSYTPKQGKPQESTRKCHRFGVCCALQVILVLALPVTVAVVLHAYNYNTEELNQALTDYIKHSPCLIDSGALISEVARPLFNCSRCKDLRQFPDVDHITPEEFRARYAYSTVPVIVRGAAANWTAMHTFTYQYFKDLYLSHEGSIENVEEQCQFFSYESEFLTLQEAFSMPQARVDRLPEERPWYFGWSNCHDQIKNELRRHYKRPYFLPKDSEAGDLDWMFMGCKGPGASMHLDFVNRPSWQAQITGRKTWTLEPVPDCEDVCHQIKVTVNPGDIIVLDTNQWYHMTEVQDGDISLTIGAEYD